MGARPRGAALATAGVALALAGCGSDQSELAGLDHTGSSAGGTVELCTRDLMTYAEKRYAPSGGARGSLRVELVDENTARAPTWPVVGDFTIPSDDQSSPRKVREHIESALDGVKRDIDEESIARGPSGGRSDLVGFLAAAGDAARSHEAKRIWLCTDGLDSRLGRPITTAEADRVLAELKRKEAMPDLEGIDVVLDTVSVLGRDDLDSAEQGALKRFWEQLIDGAGGDLVDYGPSPG